MEAAMITPVTDEDLECLANPEIRGQSDDQEAIDRVIAELRALRKVVDAALAFRRCVLAADNTNASARDHALATALRDAGRLP